MCGIAGVFCFQGYREPRETVRRMTRVLIHRGPDDEGYYVDEEVMLGHRRLSIIDLDTGSQPLANEDSTIRIVFNGEIYNYIELRDELRARGHIFKTESDTEVILHLYEEHGAGCLEHLNGMFAFGLWDSARGRLLLARDRLGQKPLLYGRFGDRLFFSSELKSFFAIPGFSAEVNTGTIPDYLKWGYVPHPQTMLKGVYKLPPAHFLVVERSGSISESVYWTPPDSEDNTRTRESYREELREVLADAVRIRLRSDVEVGAFLSGGLDSSLIVALMKLTGDDVRTYSIGFEELDYDERPWSDFVASYFETTHHSRVVKADIHDTIEKVTSFYDEPFGDTSSIPTYLVSNETAKHVKVALSGDGGDELFAGYNRYKNLYISNLFSGLPRTIREGLSGLVRGVPPRRYKGWKRNIYRLHKLLQRINMSGVDQYLPTIAMLLDYEIQDILSPEFYSKPAPFLEKYFEDNSFSHPVGKACYGDLHTYLPGDILHKVDMASMANSLEVRSPFMDYRVVELAMTIPATYKIFFTRTKLILKDAFRDLFPSWFWSRPKQGFGLPLTSWFRGELRGFVEDALFAKRTLDRGYFNRDTLDRLWQEHLRGEADHGDRLWMLIALELWHRKFIDTPAG